MRGKSLFIAVLLISAGFLVLSGCTTIFSGWREQKTEPVERGNFLPEWLLLSHRVQEDPETAAEPVLPELQVSEPGDTDDADSNSANGHVTVIPAGEAASTSQQPATGAPAPAAAAAAAAADDDDDDEEEEEEEARPGTMAWILEKPWIQEQIKAAEEEKKKKEEEEEKEWWDLDEGNGDSKIQYEKD